MEVIKLTEAAQERASSLLSKENEPKEGLRIAVIGGGCSGYQYKLGFDNVKESDEVHEYPNGLVVMVDPKSDVLLKGCTLEFHDQIDKTGFEVQNPNATGCCGCGQSFCA